MCVSVLVGVCVGTFRLLVFVTLIKFSKFKYIFGFQEH